MGFIVRGVLTVAGYYLTFLSSVFMTESGRTLRKTLRPFFLSGRLAPLKPVYDVLGWFLALFTMNYLVVSFILHRLDLAMIAFRSVGYAGHVLILTPIVVFNILGLGKVVRRWHPAVEGAAADKSADGVKSNIKTD